MIQFDEKIKLFDITGDSNECRDKNSYCQSWANAGECQRNAAYMSDNCKKSCNQCGIYFLF